LTEERCRENTVESSWIEQRPENGSGAAAFCGECGPLRMHMAVSPLAVTRSVSVGHVFLEIQGVVVLKHVSKA